jgi:type II secretory pathway pseudopilin PulG
MRRPDGGAQGEGGFTYVGLIVLVAIIGMVGAATLKVDALLRRAAAEQELLEIGAAFSQALKSYAEATPRGQPTYPPSLQELLKDPRSPAIRRHLRKIFVDPITGKAEWGIVHAGNDTGVLAVYSLSKAKPLKVANFDGRFANLENREKISDWKFAALGQGVGQPGQQGQAGQLGQPGQPGQNAGMFQPGIAQSAPGQGSLFPAGGAPGQNAPVPPPPQPVAEPPPVPPEEAPSAAPPPAEAAGAGAGDDKPEDKEDDTRDDKRDEREPPAAPAG